MSICTFDGYLLLGITTFCCGLSVSTVIGNVQEVCMGEYFRAECPDGHVVKISSALYGRMHANRCARLGNIGCIADAMEFLDMKCSGRQQCDFQTPENHLINLNPCPTDYPPYLEAVYGCILVISEPNLLSQCQSSGFIALSGIMDGIIASSIAKNSRQGTRLCPWVIHANDGQHVNITLLDFGTHSTEVTGATCDIYATITEHSSPSPTMICSGIERERTVYLSSSSHIEIQFIDNVNMEEDPQFLLQFSVVGCQDPPLNGNVLKQRTVHKAVLHCKGTGEDQHIYCRGTSWDPQVQQCDESGWTIFSKGWSSRQGVWIVLGTGIAIGIVIGLGFLFCGIMCYKRFKDHENPCTHDTQYDANTRGQNEKYFYAVKNDEVPYGEMNYATYDRGASTAQKTYMPAVNPVNRDVMVIETAGTLKYQSITLKAQENTPVRYMDQEESAYEKPL